MASLVTQVTIAGNLTRDPELRYTQSGLPVASFTIASTPRSLNKETKQYEDGEPLFQNCTLWGKPAEHFAASANKGTRVIAAGQLKARTYQTNAGETKTGIDLIVDEIGLSVMFAEVGAHSAPARQAPTYPATGGQTQVPDEEPW